MVLRYLLRNWLHSTAQRKIREKVVEAATRQHSAADAGPEPERSGAAAAARRLGVVFALQIEASGLEDLLGGMVTTRGHGFVVRQGRLKDRQIVLILSGAGRQRAARATEALIAGHKPHWVISAGFAGGLDPKLRRHDIVVADELLDTAGNRLPVDLPFDPAALASARGVHLGRLLMADRVVRLPKQKLALLGQHDALAVDMESLAVAEACRGRRIGFLAVRVINDTADEELPPDIERLLAQKSTAGQFGAAVGAIWRRPSSAKDMYRLKENALLASDRLAKFLVRMIAQLTPQ
jgi:adenosylhomocysteine nucleosidase